MAPFACDNRTKPAHRNRSRPIFGGSSLTLNCVRSAIERRAGAGLSLWRHVSLGDGKGGAASSERCIKLMARRIQRARRSQSTEPLNAEQAGSDLHQDRRPASRAVAGWRTKLENTVRCLTIEVNTPPASRNKSHCGRRERLRS